MDSKKIRYPIYIISKGRYEKPLMANALMAEKIPFKIAIEPQELDNYAVKIPREFIEVLPFSNLGMGSYPARNWCWEHSIREGHKRHFLFDDNIHGFRKRINGKRMRCATRDALICLEDFTDRYANIAISGFNYSSFVPKQISKPFYLNTHVYSGILINNSIPYRWRMKYNEDIDICLQALHNKYCTILLNVYTIDKVSTSSKMKGGNQDELYKNNDPRKKMLKARSLERIWPQYVKTGIRYNRPHHFVIWRKHFKQPLKRLVTAGEELGE